MWSKVDDKLHNHRKARKAGLEAMGLWVVCLSYCGDQLTDGFVPDWYVATWHPGAKGLRLAHQLVKAGLWIPAENDGEIGWEFHDYLELNPTRKKVLADRKKEAERKAEQRKANAAKHQQAGLSQGDNQRDTQWDSGVVSEDPDPTRPDQTRSNLLRFGIPSLREGTA